MNLEKYLQEEDGGKAVIKNQVLQLNKEIDKVEDEIKKTRSSDMESAEKNIKVGQLQKKARTLSAKKMSLYDKMKK